MTRSSFRSFTLTIPMPSAFLSAGGSVLSSTPGGAMGEPLSATNTCDPSRLRRIPRGRLPTGIVATTFCVATSITLMSPLFSLVTKTRPATGGGMGAVVGAVELLRIGDGRLRRRNTRTRAP